MAKTKTTTTTKVRKVDVDWIDMSEVKAIFLQLLANEATVAKGGTVEDKDKVPLSKTIASYAIIDRVLNGYTLPGETVEAGKKNAHPGILDLYEKLHSSLASTPAAAVKAELVAAGKLEEDEEPSICVGGKVSVGLHTTSTEVFAVDSKAIDKSEVPDKFLKTSVLLDKKKLEEAFDNGTLPDDLKSHCSKAPKVTTTIKKDQLK